MLTRRASLGVRVIFFLMEMKIQHDIRSAAEGSPIDQIGPLCIKDESLERNMWKEILIQPRRRESKGWGEGGEGGVCDAIWRFSWSIGGNRKSFGLGGRSESTILLHSSSRLHFHQPKQEIIEFISDYLCTVPEGQGCFASVNLT